MINKMIATSVKIISLINNKDIQTNRTIRSITNKMMMMKRRKKIKNKSKKKTMKNRKKMKKKKKMTMIRINYILTKTITENNCNSN